MNTNAERNVFMLLHELARLIRVEADRRARVHGMTRAGWGLISRLNRNPGMSQKELADALEVEPISVARMVDRLEAAGMLERRADASDRRIWRLHLLPAAEPVLKKMAVMAAEFESFVTQGVSPEARDTMVEALMQMKTNLIQKPEMQGPEVSPEEPPAETGSVREVA